MTPEQKSQRLTACHASWARTINRTARTEPARQALDQKIADLYGIPDDLLPEERGKRMASARTAYYRNLRARRKTGDAA